MPVLKRDDRYHTYADYLVWSRDYGDELIDGTAYVREPPPPSLPHQVIVGELYHQLRGTLKDGPSRVFIAPLNVLLPRSDEEDGQIDTVLQPDVLIVSDRHKLNERGVRGAPDWVAEVLSPSTSRYDRTLKLRAYERAGVREVWLVHPLDHTLTAYRLEGGRYGRPSVGELKGRTALTAVGGVAIDWDQVLAQLL
jgi:Uma2 family endonuclease